MCALSVVSYAVDRTYYYRVKKQDTLSDVLARFGLSPIYPHKGWLKATLAVNSVVARHPNLIRPNEIVFLPLKDIHDLMNARVLDTGEVLAIDDLARPLPLAPERKPTATVGATVAELQPELEGSPTAPPALDPVNKGTDVATSSTTVGIGVEYFRIDGVDTVNHGNARILSGTSPRLDFGYTLQWNESTAIELAGSLTQYTLTQFSQATTYDANSGIKSAFGFGANKKFSKNLSTSIFVEAAQEFFVRASAPTVISVDKVIIYEPTIRAKYSLFGKQNAQIGVSGGYGILLPTSTSAYSIGMGTKVELGAYFRHDPHTNSGRAIEGTLIYRIEKQDSSIYSKYFNEILLGISYRSGLDLN